MNGLSNLIVSLSEERAAIAVVTIDIDSKPILPIAIIIAMIMAAHNILVVVVQLHYLRNYKNGLYKEIFIII